MLFAFLKLLPVPSSAHSRCVDTVKYRVSSVVSLSVIVTVCWAVALFVAVTTDVALMRTVSLPSTITSSFIGIA